MICYTNQIHAEKSEPLKKKKKKYVMMWRVSVWVFATVDERSGQAKDFLLEG